MLVDLTRRLNRVSRSISAENRTGEPGRGGMTPVEEGVCSSQARDLGVGWKVNPYVPIDPGQTVVLADIHGMGEINHMWMAGPGAGTWRGLIIRMYWDDQEIPSVECPYGDFFCMGWKTFKQIDSLAVCVNPTGGLNCYWDMPFRKHARIEMENRSPEKVSMFYQIDYCLTDIPEDCVYFHAQFRRVNPVPYMDVYTILDGVKGRGHYVGTYMSWGSNNNGWWGEGEIKFYIDGDTDWPTICGTGTEDYFCGAYSFIDPVKGDHYLEYSGPYCGLQVIEPDRLFRSQLRFGMYRWHLADPVCFNEELRITMQDLGWREGGRFFPLQDDISSVAFWYQELPTAPFPPLGSKDYLEIV